MLTVKEQVAESKWCKETVDADLSKIVSFADNFAEAGRHIKIKFVPFSSALGANFHQEYITGKNVNYYLRFYLPNKPGQRFNELYILINGLGEAGPLIHDDIALAFAERGIPAVLFPLPNHFHRRRDFKFQDNDLFAALDETESILSAQAIVSEITAEPERLIYSYGHIMFDISNFLKSLTDDSLNWHLHRIFKEYFELDSATHQPKIRLHVLGYSLGGLVALSLKLRYPNEFHSCYLIESGANFEQIKAGVLFGRDSDTIAKIWTRRILPSLKSGKTLEEARFWLVNDFDCEFNIALYDYLRARVGAGNSAQEIGLLDLYRDFLNSDEWKTIKKSNKGRKLPVPSGPFTRELADAEQGWKRFVRSMTEKYPAVKRNALSEDDAIVFEKIVLGDHRSLYRHDLAQQCDSIFIILGGSDVLFPLAAINSFAPEETGLAIMQIPQLGHWLKFRHRDVWDVWKGFISKTVIEFSRVSPLRIKGG